MDFQDYIGQAVAKRFNDFSMELQVKEVVHNDDLHLLNKVRICLEHGLNHFKATSVRPTFSALEFYVGGNFSTSTYGIFDTVLKVINPEEQISSRILFLICEILRNWVKDLKILAPSLQVYADLNSVAFNFTSLTNVRILVVFTPPEISPTIVYEKMRGRSTQWRYYKAENIKMKLRFMPEQSSTVHYVAALLKHWLHAVTLREGCIIGDTATIAELVASYAVIEMEAKIGQNPSVYSAFVKAIEYFCFAFQFRHKLVKDNGKWQTCTEQALGNQTSYVLNPYDPAKNLLEDIPVSILEIFQQAAQIFRARLLKIVRYKMFLERDSSDKLNVIMNGGVFGNIFVIFPSFPGLDVKKMACYVCLSHCKRGLNGFEYPSNEHSVLANMIQERTRDIVEVTVEMSRHLQGCCSIKSSKSRVRLNRRISEKVRSALKVALPEMMMNASCKTNLKLEWFDCSFSVKFRTTDGLGVVVGIKWDAATLPKFDEFEFY